MPTVEINYLGVLVAAVASIALGFVWYGPLFGKQWIALMGWTQEQIEQGKAQGMGKTYAIAMLGSLVMAYVLSHALVFASSYLQVTGVAAGLHAGFWNWLGFIVPITLSSVLWEGKSWKLWTLNNAYNLLSLLIMGVIIALWM